VSAPAAFGCVLLLCIALALGSIIAGIVRKHRQRHSNVVPFRRRAGWGMVDYRRCGRKR
jgi:hypothetical protein